MSRILYLSVFILEFVLLFLQFKTTTLTQYLPLSEIEQVEQGYRTHQYPPSTYRLAHIIEDRPESIIISKLARNFFEIFNLQIIFHQYYSPILLPLFIFGFFQIIKHHHRFSIVFLAPIILLTIIGHNNLYGPICLFPLINFSLFIGIYYLLIHEV